MEWYHVLAMIMGNFAVIFPIWLWSRAESRADSRHMDAKLDSNREMIHAIHKETTDLMRDFHFRLLEIERARK